MAAVDMAPWCTVCRRRHWPDTRHYGRLRLLLCRLTGRRT